MARRLRATIPVLLFAYALSTLTTMAGMEVFGWVLFIITMTLSFADRENRWLNRPVLLGSDKVLLLLFLSIVLSAIFSPDPDIDRTFVIGNGRFVFLFIAIRIALESIEFGKLQRGIYFLIPAVALIALYSISQFMSGYDIIRNRDLDTISATQELFRSGGMWGTPMTFGHSMALTFFFPLALAIQQIPANKNAQRFTILVSLLAAISIVTSFTRGAWLGVAAGIVVISLYVNHKVRWGVLTALIVVLGVGAASSAHIRNRLTSIVSTEISSNAVRIDLWRANLEMFKDYPIFGVGYGINEKILGGYFKKMGIEQEFNGHAHNNFLQFLSGTGLFGFLAFSIFSLLMLWMSHRLLRDLPAEANWAKAIALGALGAQIALHVGGLTECNFKDAEVNHQYMLILALLTVVWRRYQPSINFGSVRPDSAKVQK
jgi:O-antigen ligase